MPIHHEITIKASAESVFEALTSSKRFAALSNRPAEIDPNPGGSFTLFDGLITGRMIEFIPARRLVQAWRVGNWDEGVYSIVRFDLESIGEAEMRIEFDHTGYPDEHESHLETGWYDNYWNPLRALLES